MPARLLCSVPEILLFDNGAEDGAFPAAADETGGLLYAGTGCTGCAGGIDG